MNTFKPEIQELLKSRWKEVLSKFKDNHWFWCIFSSLKASTRCIHIHFDLKRLWGYVKTSTNRGIRHWFSRTIHRLFNFNEFCAYLKTTVCAIHPSLSRNRFKPEISRQEKKLKSDGRPIATFTCNTKDSWFEVVEPNTPNVLQGDRFEAVSFLMTTVIPRLCFKRQPENAAIYRRA